LTVMNESRNPGMPAREENQQQNTKRSPIYWLTPKDGPLKKTRRQLRK